MMIKKVISNTSKDIAVISNMKMKLVFRVMNHGMRVQNNVIKWAGARVVQENSLQNCPTVGSNPTLPSKLNLKKENERM